MKKRMNIRNLIIVILCVTIICMGIGFILLSSKLQTLKQEQPTFNVSFKKINAETPVKGGKTSPYGSNSITNQGKTLNMQLNLNAPRDELAYTIIIKNEGTLPAEIINLVESPDYINDPTSAQKIAPVVITHNDIIGKILEPKEETELKVVATYTNTTDITPKKISYQLNLVCASKEED